MGIRTQMLSNGTTQIWTWPDERPDKVTMRVVKNNATPARNQALLESEERRAAVDARIRRFHRDDMKVRAELEAGRTKEQKEAAAKKRGLSPEVQALRDHYQHRQLK